MRRLLMDAVTARVRALEDQAEIAQLVARYGPAVDSGSGEEAAELWTRDGGDRATGRGYALNIRWDPDADGFRVARVSANSWRWARTAHGWRVVERVNANLDGTAAHRELPAPAVASASAAGSGPDSTPGPVRDPGSKEAT